MEMKEHEIFCGFDYATKHIQKEYAEVYRDCMPSFGWELDEVKASITPKMYTMKFKRKRALNNKMELKRLNHTFESCIHEIHQLEASKTSKANFVAYSVGLAATGFMAGSVMVLSTGNALLCVLLAVPAILGWIVPTILFQRIRTKKTTRIHPFIEVQYDIAYQTCEKAQRLLTKQRPI